MLSKIRSRSSRLLYGAVSLTMLIALFSPVTSSAAVLDTAPPKTHVTYVNLAQAASLWSNQTDYSVRFQLRQSSASIINADNGAVALTSGCRDCGAIAIAFQVVFASTRTLTALNVDSRADATSTYCVRCSTLAEAYELVYVSNTRPRLTLEQLAGLEHVRLELEALRYSGLSVGQIKSEVAEIANQAIALLRDSDAPASGAPTSDPPAASPAIHGPALAQPTKISQPVIKLFVKIKSA